ncbi:MAG: hypothetical protein GY703_25440, partial [Gammaproteobacteria bacterium]|nr:hypothetical protein [Gammaproteobacteria bacterium]
MPPRKIIVSVEDKKIQAVVDTGADTTIISEKTYALLPKDHPCVKKTLMRAAGEHQTFMARQVGPVKLKFGHQTLHTLVYVANIVDDMLVGLDLLTTLEATLSFGKEPSLTFDGQTLPLVQSSRIWDPGTQDTSIGSTETEQPDPTLPTESDVICPKRIVIPANSEMVIPVSRPGLANNQVYILEPNHPRAVLIARAMYESEEEWCISCLNLSNTPKVLKKGTVLGSVSAVEAWESAPITVNRVNVGKDIPSIPNQGLPEHLQKLYLDSSWKLEPDDQEKLKNLLIEFQDIFAKSEYDLGHFSAFEHTIDTGEATPIKLGLRRTPWHFREQEEELLTKML